MAKKTRLDRRHRVPRSIYREADALAAVMADERTPQETREALMDALLELSMSTGVHVYTASIVREAYLCMVDAFHKAQEDCALQSVRDEIRHDFNKMESLLLCVTTTDEEGQTRAIDLALWNARQDDLADVCATTTPDADEEETPCAATSQANIVDLLCWKQSRPRTIVRPLFSFPESEAS